MIYVVYILGSVLISKTIISTSEKTTYFNLAQAPETHKVLTNGLKIAFKFYYSGESSANNFTVYAEYVTVYNQNQRSIVSVATESWKLQDFAGSTIDIKDSENITWFTFPENVTLTGNKFAERNSYVRIIYTYNTDETQVWKTIANQINSTALMQLHVVTPYVDYEDINVPIKYAYLDKYYTYADTRSYTFHDIAIRK